jgi:UDP-N-acetylglucosamine--N-acetylmuramyl-(pentapeptide) pyrophosphoryl-undecaprenol N-acetylglucosamine transferase
LINFEETRKYFPAGRTEVTGLPVREEFFHLPEKQGGKFTVLITGGSQGSRTLNEAARQSWPMFREAGMPVRLILQTGTTMYKELSGEFCRAQLSGEVSDFIADMPAAFAQADFIVCRSGAGAVSELAAAGKPAMLIPFPFAADNHQLKNAEAFARAGAARLSLDKDWNGQKLFEIVQELYTNPGELRAMSEAGRKLAHSGAARRAAEILREVAIDSTSHSPNNK